MITSLPIKITPNAFDKIKLIIKEKSIPQGYGLRIGTNKAMSCGTTSFVLGFDTKKTGDDSFTYQDLDIFINKKEMLFLIDITLDFVNMEEVSGFKFEKLVN